MIKLLLDNGADINAEDMVGRAPKQLAYVNGNNEAYQVINEFLLKLREKINNIFRS